MKSTYGTMYFVRDMARSVAYFRTLLGVKPRFESPEWTEFPIGDHALCLHARRRAEKRRPNGVLIVNVKGVKSVFERMKRTRLKVVGLHEIHPGAWSFTLTDPSGNELSFYGPG
ncbi:MAG TPA: VOC family protein [Planctomycetota bacterium]|nr:VOC family protein [Planctomycetota bacterium]